MFSASWCSEALDSLGKTATQDVAFQRMETFCQEVAGPVIVSIHQNVTTVEHPRNEVFLRRLYSSSSALWPVGSAKRKTRTPWTEAIFVRGEVFVSEGVPALERHFDDYALMQRLNLRRAINIPIPSGNVCIATFNVFGTQEHWRLEEIAGLRVLALAASRWLSPAPGLDYRFDEPARTERLSAGERDGLQ